MLLAVVGVGVIAIGFVCALFALYLVSIAGSAGSPATQQVFGDLLLAPLAALFRGGVVTLVIGFVLLLSGGSTLFIFA